MYPAFQSKKTRADFNALALQDTMEKSKTMGELHNQWACSKTMVVSEQAYAVWPLQDTGRRFDARRFFSF